MSVSGTEVGTEAMVTGERENGPGHRLKTPGSWRSVQRGTREQPDRPGETRAERAGLQEGAHRDGPWRGLQDPQGESLVE